MRLTSRIGLITLTAIFSLANITTKAYAAEKQFSTDYVVSYQVLDTGETQVTQNVNITNLKSDVIVSSYTFTVSQLQPYDIQGQSNSEIVAPSVTTANGQTSITIKINNYVIGSGRQNKLVLFYKTKDLAAKIGEIWNVNIPKTQITDATSSYDVQLSVPESFGPKIFVSPIPTTEKNETGKNNYSFTKAVLMDRGITASFGKYQIINYRLRYQIENPTLLDSMYEITFPSDIPEMQQVDYTSIDPKPVEIKTDGDGNAIGIYKLAPKQKQEIQLIGSVRISGKQINPEFGGKFPYIPKSLTKNYTKDMKFWEVNSINVQELAQKLKNTDKTVSQNAQNLYNYITNNLKYNYEGLKQTSVQRKGADAALAQKESNMCMEFTDVFVATARAMGIPAREVDGFAFASDEKTKPLAINLKSGDFLHSWAEFYDPFYGWVQIDPTWGSTSGMDYFTKLDTNHLTLATKGLDSENPKPAGSYRFDDAEKLVEVDFSQTTQQDNFEDKLILYKAFSLNPIQAIKGNVAYTIKNEGGTFVYGIKGKVLEPGEQALIYLPRNSTTVAYKDFNGADVSKNLIIGH
jgi:transglutaminase-like putative cysteine protease